MFTINYITNWLRGLIKKKHKGFSKDHFPTTINLQIYTG
jgi:hypothetical protein